jgi:hypothetical protein
MFNGFICEWDQTEHDLPVPNYFFITNVLDESS